MKNPVITKASTDHLKRLTAHFGLLICALLLAAPARASMPQHRADDPSQMHGGHTPAAQTETTEHVHPVAAPDAPVKVDLEEHLGAPIPLDLEFRDEQGRPIRLAELVTRPTIIAPVYYRCPNVCHFLQGDLARVLPDLKLKAGEDFQVISISFDETETPELAKRSRDTYYAAMNDGIAADGWRFLTGDLDNILALTDAAGYHFQRVNSDFVHPVAFFIVAADGRIMRYLHGTRVLPKDLTLALYEAREGRVGTTIRKMVQFCFSFDPEQKTYVFNILRVSATAILATLAIFAAFLILGGRRAKKDKNL